MSEERRKVYNVYSKLQVYNVFNVAQTNLQEARPELYKKLEAAAGVNRPLNHGDDFSFPAMDKMIKENGWICPIKPVYGDNAYYSIFNQHIDAMQLKIDQEQSQEAEQKQEKAPTMYYASVAYLQTTDATDRLDNFKNDGDYNALLTEAKELPMVIFVFILFRRLFIFVGNDYDNS